MSGFDPVALRRTIESDGLFLPSEDDIEKFRPDAVGNAAVLSLLEIVAGWLAGERVRLSEDLDRAVRWLEDAENRREKFGSSPWFHTVRRKRALALARWLRDGNDERDLWLAAGETAAKALSTRKVSQAEFAEYNLADGMLDFLLAGHRAEGTELAARIDKVSHAKWPPEARLALECCKVPGSTLPAGWKDFLQERLRCWLDEGEFIRAACWLKFFLGHGGGDAESVLLAAYDFLPGIEPPPMSRAP